MLLLRLLGRRRRARPRNALAGARMRLSSPLVKRPTARIVGRWLALLWVGLLLPAVAQDPSRDPAPVSIDHPYSNAALRRIREWQALLDSGAKLSTTAKLKAVNDFFNDLEFVDDILLWEAADYWATPVEFLAKGAGDCEDFAIAKYFTLVEMGVSSARLQITYVKAHKLNQAHMVLAYYATPASDPRVLDNLVAEVLPGSARSDLTPVYSFNGRGLWIAKARGNSRRVGSATRIGPWRDLVIRMKQSKVHALFPEHATQ